MTGKPKDGPVVAATRRDLRAMGPLAAKSSLGASALALAAGLDDPDTSLTSKSMAAKSFADTMATLRAIAPPERKKDGLDRVGEQREKRLAALARRDARAANRPGP